MINKIAFKANIKFVTNEEFKQRTSHINKNDENEDRYIGVHNKQQRKYEPSFYQDSFYYNKTKTAPEGLTGDAYGCIAGGLTNRTLKMYLCFIIFQAQQIDLKVK